MHFTPTALECGEESKAEIADVVSLLSSTWQKGSGESLDSCITSDTGEDASLLFCSLSVLCSILDLQSEKNR